MLRYLGAPRRRLHSLLERLHDWVEHLRGTNPYVRADFSQGGATLHKYLCTHRNKYYRHVGAHLLVQLYEAGPEVFEGFARKHSQYGWHFPLTQEEAEALKRARDITSTHRRIANMRYGTNVFEQVTNSRQLLRMLGLGAVAGSAGLLLALSQLYVFAREALRELLLSVGIDLDQILSGPDNSAFIELAEDITEGATNADGSFNSTIVAERIEHLVQQLRDAEDMDSVVGSMSADLTYMVGILTGIIVLVVGRGLIQLILEGMGGATSKIDALVCDLDDFANWKLGRSPFPPTSGLLPGDLILPARAGLIRPGDAPSAFRMPPRHG